MEQCRPYNLSKLLYYIIKFTPKEKRLSFVENINRNEEMWKDNDDLKDYRKGIIEEFEETVTECATKGADIGGSIGSIFGSAGEAAGRAIGGVVGGAVGVVKTVIEHIPTPTRRGRFSVEVAEVVATLPQLFVRHMANLMIVMN